LLGVPINDLLLLFLDEDGIYLISLFEADLERAKDDEGFAGLTLAVKGLINENCDRTPSPNSSIFTLASPSVSIRLMTATSSCLEAR
jgi:hypothetical protein